MISLVKWHKSVDDLILVFFEDVGVIDVVLDGIGDWIVPGNAVHLEIGFSSPLQMLCLHLLLNLSSQRQLLLPPLGLPLVLQLQLPHPVCP
jgi:hypothetical protein